ncbi:MAG: DUF1987 domain-containing protein [Flavobacteriales bacterium]|jgi:hypothetical protein|nr:DUF1987 domain-containing protein [Flavobacteriales bacterium]
MQRFELPATDHTPAIVLDPELGLMEISGRSIPENADRFFTPLHSVLEEYARAPRPTSVVRVHLSYFNSTSAKYLLDLFRQWEDLHASGASTVRMEWVHARNDADMVEAGEDFRSLLELPVKLVALSS